MDTYEIPDVAEMTVNAFNSYYPDYSLTNLKSEIKNLTHEISKLTEFDVSKYFVLYKGAKLIGSVALTVYEKHCYLNSMVINQKHQRQGYGSILLDKVCKNVDELGLGKIFLYANRAGKKMYDKYGFTSLSQATPIKINYVKPVKQNIAHQIEFNLDLPKWIQEIETKFFGESRLKLYEYLFSLEMDLLSLGNEAFCTLRGQTIGNVYANDSESAIAILHQAWKLGGEYLNSLDNSIVTLPKGNISYRPIDDLSCTRMTLGQNDKIFENRYGILSFGFG